MRTCFIFLILSISLLVNQNLDAQNAKFVVKGKIAGSQDQKSIEFATIMILDAETEESIAGTTTDEEGRFKIETPSDKIQVKISFIGFETRILKDITFLDRQADLGTLTLNESVKTLDEVVIQGEKSQVEFQLDKRVFRVGKDLSSTGASALEVLNNVPSVNVNIEGVISLRGSSGVQILINGKPSVLASEEGNALGTITADMIEKVEVITNPSAKYEAEGTSGIINIVLKKEERKGINGSVTINTGFPNNHSLGLSLNRRTEKFNLFAQVGAGYRTQPSKNENINRNLRSNTEINSIGESDKNENFYNLILGTDYHINKYNVLSLTGSFAYEIETEFSETDFRVLNDGEILSSQWLRKEETEATNPKWQYELQYKKDFADNKEHNLLFSALGRSFSKDQASVFNNDQLVGETPFGDQETRTDFSETTYTFKLDYTKPFSEAWTLEAGSQYLLTDVSNDFAVNEWINGEWMSDARQTNVFDYDQKVLGIYSTGAYEGDKWGLKLGLRAENTDLQTLLVNTDERNKQNFVNLFPSAHTSYKISPVFSLQAGYSRRIRRPRMWDLNPFFNIRNNFSIRTGNPNLQPEFTDSYEITSIYVFENLSLNLGLYHRFTTDVVERISNFENEINTIKPLNIGTNRATGLEFNGKYNPMKWLTFTADFNYLYFNRQGDFQSQSFDFSANQYFGKLTSKVKFPADIDFEITGHYQSKYQTVQSVISKNLFADLGLRKKIMKGKAVINLSIRDVFASRIRESNTLQPDFYLYSWGQRGRFTTIGFSYGFGKGEAMEFSGQKRRR